MQRVNAGFSHAGRQASFILPNRILIIALGTNDNVRFKKTKKTKIDQIFNGPFQRENVVRIWRSPFERDRVTNSSRELRDTDTQTVVVVVG